MRLIGKNKLQKLKAKNTGNKLLCIEIDKLISDIEISNWKDEGELKKLRNDADCVHNEGFYFFNISIHRTMVLVEFGNEAEATVVWAGDHKKYESIFIIKRPSENG